MSGGTSGIRTVGAAKALLILELRPPLVAESILGGFGNDKSLFLLIIKILAVQAVSSEPVSPEFPVKQGKNRDF